MFHDHILTDYQLIYCQFHFFSFVNTSYLLIWSSTLLIKITMFYSLSGVFWICWHGKIFWITLYFFCFLWVCLLFHIFVGAHYWLSLYLHRSVTNFAWKLSNNLLVSCKVILLFSILIEDGVIISFFHIWMMQFLLDFSRGWFLV